jgi:hypothetical protein
MTTPTFALGEARASALRRMDGPDTRALFAGDKIAKGRELACYLPGAPGAHCR